MRGSKKPKVRNYSSTDTASHPRRSGSSTTPLWEL